MNREHAHKNEGILLEAGTNELEIVEFSIKGALYGINIAKVREIIKADIDLVQVPDSHSSLEGAINLRGKIIPVINLAKHLGEKNETDKKISRIIISEFNQITVGFLVDSVARIHRISWKKVEKPSEMLQTEGGYAVGIVRIENRVLFLLDFEKIAADVNPKSGIRDAKTTNFTPGLVNIDRSTKVVLVAEDSEFIRGMMLDYLNKAGYKTITANNGEEAWAKISAIINANGFNDIANHLHLMITDIEMPQMDGLHLIKRVKENPHTKKLPCISFSSMISTELSQKCKSVGSDAEISKPEIEKLVSVVDQKVL
ncbi:MAG: chemotaxis protein CheV [Candidatus Omnitrophica bacterium]|nr:chemotaxis protein CheV [Candidatus Omnitrophota bacterium]